MIMFSMVFSLRMYHIPDLMKQYIENTNDTDGINKHCHSYIIKPATEKKLYSMYDNIKWKLYKSAVV